MSGIINLLKKLRELIKTQMKVIVLVVIFIILALFTKGKLLSTGTVRDILALMAVPLLIVYYP